MGKSEFLHEHVFQADAGEDKLEMDALVLREEGVCKDLLLFEDGGGRREGMHVEIEYGFRLLAGFIASMGDCEVDEFF